jgi:hypothetical protein
MREVDQIVVPLGCSYDLTDMSENLKLSLRALGLLITALGNNPSTYGGTVSPMYAVGEYIDYLESMARTIHEVLYEAEREGSTHDEN